MNFWQDQIFEGLKRMNKFAPMITADKKLTHLLSLIFSALFSSGVLVAADPLETELGQGLQGTIQGEIVFSGSDATSWRLYLGSSSNWMVPVNGPVTTSHKSKVVTVSRIDNLTEADAIQAEWNGGLGQVYWQDDNPRDFRTLSQQGGALSMVIRIDKRPEKSVDLKMDCGYPCAGSLDMTKLFKSVPEHQWFRISLKLSCFEKAGANLSHIVAPIVVATTGSFEMSFSDVRLIADAPEESLVACG
jgi:beta-glucosidase